MKPTHSPTALIGENYSPQPGTIADHPAGPPLLSATTITAKPPAVVPSAEGLIQLQKLDDYWSDSDRMKQSERNAANRAKNKAEMKAIEDAITAKTIPPKTDREMLDEVLKRTNRAHIASLGRNLAGTGNLDSGRSQPDPGYCTHEQLEDLKRQHALEKEDQRKAFQSQQNALKKICGFLQPSTSSTSPVPSSTPLGLGDCYTRTFDPETSQCGEQDDNDSDNGNREYDVDIYDDE
ncbi:hypothetical protein Tco_0340925 [Tanacetum coccineum]